MQSMGRLKSDRLAGSVLAVFAGFILLESRNIPFGTMADPGPGAVPVLLALSLLVCSIVVALGRGGGVRVAAIEWTEWRHGLAILGTCSFMAFAIERAGYRLTIFIALLFLAAVVERVGWVVGAIFALAFSLGTYYLFATLLRVTLPQGPFGF